MFIFLNTQKNTKSRFCGDRDETVNSIISECTKLIQKEYKRSPNWMGYVN